MKDAFGNEWRIFSQSATIFCEVLGLFAKRTGAAIDVCTLDGKWENVPSCAIPHIDKMIRCLVEEPVQEGKCAK